jgi:CxxC-x17-CxxC domain-containing protein
MVAADRMIVCRDCGTEFVFTAGEQAFYAERGFVPPTRCPSCRASRRAERQGMPGDMTGTRPPGMAPSQPRQLFPAICAECGRETMVPFEPRAGRPVYCRDCFSRQRAEYR